MDKIYSRKTYAVVERLPWLQSPRIIEEFPTPAEAQDAASLLNATALDSSFFVAEVAAVLYGGFEAAPSMYTKPILGGSLY